MANQTVTILESDGVTETDLVILDVGRQAAAASKSVALSTEDKAVFDAMAASLATLDDVNANGRAAAADSEPVVLSTEDLAAINGNLSVFRSLDLDESEEEVKASAGKLYKLRITNFATSPRYVKLYNATAANVTVGTTTPIDTIVVPAAAASDACVITENFGGKGLTFSTALSMAATTGLADGDAGAPGANEVVVSAYYE